MKSRLLSLLILPQFIFILLYLPGCTERIEEQDIYQRPDWLVGKLVDQLKNEEDLSTYIACLEKTGYDSILNTSGSFTLIAPTDAAFNVFFENHPVYNSIDDIPTEELKSLIEYQIIYNAWTRKQFQTLDVSGWIDPGSQSYNEPRGFKRQTVYRQPNRKYPVKQRTGYLQITNQDDSKLERIVYTSSSKYAPVFFQDYLSIYGLDGNDYQFYFNREFEPGEIYYAGAQIDNEIPAENGFIYKSDRLILPLKNGEEIMANGSGDLSYYTMLNMIYEFSQLRSNFEATYNQPGAEQGADVDTLYDVDYPDLLFNISSEINGKQNLTIREHHGLLAPTDNAFETFNAAYIDPGWGSLENLPSVIKSIIINTHMSERAIYPTDIYTGFLNGAEDRLFIDAGDIVQKTYGSNCSFIGMNKVIVPRAFKSVARPVYLERGYLNMLYAMERTKVLSAIKSEDGDFSFYIPSDKETGLYGGDSSLFVNYLDVAQTKYNFRAFDAGSRRFVTITTPVLRKMLLNQIGARTPTGIPQKEFIENLGGNFIVVDNVSGTVSGSAPSTYGYKGSEPIDIKPELYNQPTDNGNAYLVNAFFSFTNRTFWTLFTSKFLKFQQLLRTAGLYDVIHNDYPFLTKNEYYTVFIPSDSVIDHHRLDTLPKEDLRKLLQYHFVKGQLIFTDGYQNEDHYKTTRLDEKSNEITTKYSTLHIRPTPDLIQIIDKNGNVYATIPENKDRTNIMVTIDADNSSDYGFITTGVVHVIDHLLVKDILQEN